MGIGRSERFAEIARGGFDITSFLGVKNVDTSVEVDDNHDRFLSVKVQTNTMPAWCVKRQVNSTVGSGL